MSPDQNPNAKPDQQNNQPKPAPGSPAPGQQQEKQQPAPTTPGSAKA